MKLTRIGPVGAERPAVLTLDGQAYDLSQLTSDINGAFLADHGVERVRDALIAGHLRPIDIAEHRVGAPVARPGKVVCVGLNYRDHAEETGAEVPIWPFVFLKAPYTVIGSNDKVLVPRGSVKTDYEVEPAVVIGATASYLDSPDDVAAVVAGYAVSHDVSEREFQLEYSGQWDLGKSCATFNPLGPWLVPASDVDVSALEPTLLVNGDVRQRGSTKEMVFDPAYLVWYLSQYMVLEPGDVINTGTRPVSRSAAPTPHTCGRGTWSRCRSTGWARSARRWGRRDGRVRRAAWGRHRRGIGNRPGRGAAAGGAGRAGRGIRP